MYKKYIICIPNIISTLQYITVYAASCGKLASQCQHKSCTKKCLEFENNAVGCMTFQGSQHVSWDHNKSLTLTIIV